MKKNNLIQLQVCTDHNETFPSDCEVHRQRCLCLTKHEDCKSPQYSHVQIDYYGVCREMPVGFSAVVLYKKKIYSSKHI